MYGRLIVKKYVSDVYFSGRGDWGWKMLIVS